MINQQNIQKALLLTGGLLTLGVISYLLLRKRQTITEGNATAEEIEYTIVDEPETKEQQTDTDSLDTKDTDVSEIIQTAKVVPIPVEKKQTQPSEKTETSLEANDDFPLKLGSKGERVRKLQTYLLKNHGTAGIVNDLFDNTLLQRVKRIFKTEQISEEFYNTLI